MINRGLGSLECEADSICRLSCPFCGSLRSGHYNKKSCRFVCVNVACPRCGEVVDYEAFEAERDKLTAEFFDEFRALADGNSWDELERLAKHLLTKGVDPYLALELVAAWNEVRARPPMSRVLLIHVVDWVAENLRTAA